MKVGEVVVASVAVHRVASPVFIEDPGSSYEDICTKTAASKS